MFFIINILCIYIYLNKQYMVTKKFNGSNKLKATVQIPLYVSYIYACVIYTHSVF